jgi:hypothetical protein
MLRFFFFPSPFTEIGVGNRARVKLCSACHIFRILGLHYIFGLGLVYNGRGTTRLRSSRREVIFVLVISYRLRAAG